MKLRWLVLLLLLAGLGTLTWMAITPSKALRQGPLIVFIPPHEGILGIAGRVADADVVRSRLAFVSTAVARGVFLPFSHEAQRRSNPAGRSIIRPPMRKGASFVIALKPTGPAPNTTTCDPASAGLDS